MDRRRTLRPNGVASAHVDVVSRKEKTTGS